MDKSKLTLESAKFLTAFNRHLHQYGDDNLEELEQNTRGIYALLCEKRSREGLPPLEVPKVETVVKEVPTIANATKFNIVLSALTTTMCFLIYIPLWVIRPEIFMEIIWTMNGMIEGGVQWLTSLF